MTEYPLFLLCTKLQQSPAADAPRSVTCTFDLSSPPPGERGRFVNSLKKRTNGIPGLRRRQITVKVVCVAADQPAVHVGHAVIGNFRQGDELSASLWAARHHCSGVEEGFDLPASCFSHPCP